MLLSYLPTADAAQMHTIPPELERRPLPQLADALCSRCEAIIEQWKEQTVLLEPALYERARDEFVNEIDAILQVMAEALKANAREQWQALADKAPVHGFQRFEHEFTIADLFGEYRILRRAIVMHVEDELGRRCSIDEATSLHTSIDFMVRQGVLAIVKTQKERLMQSSESKLRYLSFLSHDLANNLLVVSTTLETLSVEMSRMPELEHVANILKRGMEAIQQTRDGTRRMIEHDRLRQSGSAPRIHNVDVHNVVLKCVQTLEESARLKGLTFEIDVPPNCFAITDADLLGIIFQNLFGNAIKHFLPNSTPSRSVISIRVRPNEKAIAPCWMITVADSGPGMDHKTEQSVRELLRDSDKLGELGSGIGMSIVAQAAKMLNTCIDFKTQLGQGTAFTFTLPLAT